MLVKIGHHFVINAASRLKLTLVLNLCIGNDERSVRNQHLSRKIVFAIFMVYFRKQIDRTWQMKRL